MRIDLRFNYVIEIPDCKMDTLIGGFKKLLPLILSDYFSTILLAFANWYMAHDKLPLNCERCGGDVFHWKTRNAKPTTLTTIFGELVLGQLQIQCNGCGKKMFITRRLLSLGKWQRMSPVTRRMLALIGSLTTFRVSEKILGMFGISLNRMSVWRCVQEEGEAIEFDLDPGEAASGQADGTGIPIRGIKKRGKELKLFIQEKIGGGVRIAGLAIGDYNGGWNKLFLPFRESFKMFETFLLVTDGDTEILRGLKGLNIIFQRCLWHIPHQLKYFLWRDGVARKSAVWKNVMGEIFNITAIRGLLGEDEVEPVLESKMRSLKKLLRYCRGQGLKSSFAYLKNASPDMFTSLKKRLNGKTTSKAERVMKTVNMRVNVGKWSQTGALNAMKVRLAHYYNGFDVPKLKQEQLIEVTTGG